MIQKITSLATILFLLISCEKEPDIKEFPIITTLNPINIDETGATFRGELIKEGTNKTTSYGFTWSTQEPNINTSEKIILGQELSEGVFETRINSLLSAGYEYKIRTFATYSNKTVYGNTVNLMSKGSEKTLWAKELSNIRLESWAGIPYGWSDGKNGYVIFPNKRVYKFDSEKSLFSPVADFPKLGSSETRYTSIGIDNIQYVFSNIDKNLYQLKEGKWSIKSNTPFRHSLFSSYYHNNQIYLLSPPKSFSYNLETNLWQTKASMPAAKTSIGGTNLNGLTYSIDCDKNIQKYNPQEDNWEYITTFPGNFPENSRSFDCSRGRIIGFSHENSIYFGFSHDDHIPYIEKNIYGFNLTTNSWKKIEAFPEELDYSEIFYFHLKGKLYIGYGILGNYTIYSLNTSKL